MSSNKDLLEIVIDNTKSVQEIHNKVDNIYLEISKIKDKQIEQAKDIHEHIYRTELSEKRLEVVENALLPIKEHVLMTNLVLKIVAGIATFVFAIYKLGVFSFILPS